MDPLSVTLAVVSFATLLKDIVELGLTIKGSIDKVGRNQKRLRDLGSDIIRGLNNLERYYRQHKYIFDRSMGLEFSLCGLHSELILVRDRCQQIFPAARGSRFSLVRANVKAWARRDDIEADIIRLKDHINSCYIQFTAFTSARIEHKLIVHREEDQVRLTRMEGLFTRWLVETNANHPLMNQMFASTTTINFGHNNIDYQFLRLQIRRMVDFSANVVAFGMVTEELMNLASGPLVVLPAIPRADDEAGQLQEIFMAASQMLCYFRNDPAGISIQDWADQMSSFALSLYDVGMPDVVVVGTVVVDLYRILVKHNEQAFMPYLASALHNSALDHDFASDMEGSLIAIRDSLTIRRLLHDANPNKAYKMSLARTLREFSSSTPDEDVALASARDSLGMFRALSLEAKETSSARGMPDVDNELSLSLLIKRHKGYSEFSWPSTGNPLTVSYETALSLRQLSCCLADAGSDDEAYAAQQESLDILLGLASNYPDTFHVDLADAQYGVYNCLLRIGKMQDALSELEKAIVSYRLLAQRRPHNFTISFIDTLSIYASHLCDVGRDKEVPAIREEAVNAFRNLLNGSDSAVGPGVFKNVSSHLTALGRHDEAIIIIKERVEIYRLRFRTASQTAPSPASDITEFIDALSTYATILRDVGRESEALAIEEDALQPFRKLVDCFPDEAFRLRNVFLEVAPRLQALGRYDDAIAIAEEGLEIHRLHFRSSPESAVRQYIDTLFTFATLLQGVGQSGNVPAVEQEARQAFKKFIDCCPDQALDLPNVFLDHSSRLQDLGRHEEAIAIAKEGADIYRLHIRNIPETASLQVGSEMDDFVNTLLTFAALLQGVGRDSEALAVEEEALQAFRKIVSHCPDRALHVRNVFMDHSWHLRELGHHEEAIAIAKEGAHIYRLLIRDMPQTAPSLEVAYWMGEFIDVLCISFILLQEVGRDTEALAIEEEALEPFQNFVNYRPDLALDSLENMLMIFPSWLLILGRDDEAVEFAKKSVDIYRPLIRDIPMMKPVFASNLVDFAYKLYCSRRWADSLAFNREAVEAYRSIPTDSPRPVAAFMEALRNFAMDLVDAGDADGALSACEEAFEVHRGLVGESLPRDTESNAWAHLTQADIFYGMGRYSEASVASEAAITLFHTAPDENLGRALGQLSNCLLALGQAPDALAASEEAMKILQGLKVQYPGLLSRAGKAYSKSLATLGRETEALAAAEEAESLCRKAFQESPCTWGAFDFNLADIVCNFSICLAATGRLDEALANNLEAVEIYRKVVSTRPGYYPEFAKALHSLSTRLSEAGRHDEALMNIREAVEIYREAVITRPGRSSELAQALQSLSIRLWEACRRDEAIDTCAEIVDIRQRLVVTDPNSARLLREAQDKLAARISDKAQLTAPSTDTIQDVAPWDQIPAATKDVLLPQQDSDIGQDVRGENGTGRDDAFSTSSRPEHAALEALTLPGEDSTANLVSRVIFHETRGTRTLDGSSTDTPYGFVGLKGFISIIWIPRFIWDHLNEYLVNDSVPPPFRFHS